MSPWWRTIFLEAAVAGSGGDREPGGRFVRAVGKGPRRRRTNRWGLPLTLISISHTSTNLTLSGLVSEILIVQNTIVVKNMP
jgi:hypothetical protein